MLQMRFKAVKTHKNVPKIAQKRSKTVKLSQNLVRITQNFRTKSGKNHQKLDF